MAASTSAIGKLPLRDAGERIPAELVSPEA